MIEIELMLEKDFFSILTDLINFLLAVVNIYYCSLLVYKTKEKYQYLQLFISTFYIYLLFRYAILEKIVFDIDVFYWFFFEALVFIVFIYDNHKKLMKIKNEPNIS